VLAFALERVPSVVAESLPFAFALLGVALFLAAARPEWVVVLGFALLAFVRQEPAPVDVVFAVLLVAVLFWRRESLRLPPLVSVLLFALAVVTLLSMVNADDFGRAIRFEAITLYMIALGVCLTTVFASADLTRRAVSAYIIVAALSALAAAIALEIGIPGGTYLIYGSNNLRAQGLFKDPNVFAPFLVPAAVIVLEEMVRPRLLGWRMRWKLAGRRRDRRSHLHLSQERVAGGGQSAGRSARLRSRRSQPADRDRLSRLLRVAVRGAVV
jgi:hypothetical protein